MENGEGKVLLILSLTLPYMELDDIQHQGNLFDLIVFWGQVNTTDFNDMVDALPIGLTDIAVNLGKTQAQARVNSQS